MSDTLVTVENDAYVINTRALHTFSLMIKRLATITLHPKAPKSKWPPKAANPTMSSDNNYGQAFETYKYYDTNSKIASHKLELSWNVVLKTTKPTTNLYYVFVYTRNSSYSWLLKRKYPMKWGFDETLFYEM